MLSGFIETSYRVLLLWLTLTLHPAPPVQPGLGDGFWHTRGAQLLDSANRPVRIAGVNWYGFETMEASPGGLRVQDYKTIILAIRHSGYNTIRLPLSNQMVETPPIPTSVAFSNRSGPINTDLKGLNSLEILDRIIAYAGTQGLKVILDNHRSESGDGTELSGLWFTQAFPESSWIADWQFLARRYADDPTVIGMDLRNEPHGANANGACWSCGGTNDWHLAAQRAGNAVLAINPHLLVFVEGIDVFENDYYWWGGNLEGVHSAPVRLSIPNQLVYSAHDYGPAESGQAWFTPAMTPATLSAVWSKHWAFIMQQNIAPVWLGEFGVPSNTADTPIPIPAPPATSNEAPATSTQPTNNQPDTTQSSTIAPGTTQQSTIMPGNTQPSSSQSSLQPTNTQSTSAQALESLWFQSLTQFLATDTRLNWTYWALNGDDRYGLLNQTYDGIKDSTRQQALTNIQFPLGIGLKPGHATSTIIEPIPSKDPTVASTAPHRSSF